RYDGTDQFYLNKMDYNLIATNMPQDSNGNYRVAHGTHSIVFEPGWGQYTKLGTAGVVPPVVLIGGDGDDDFSFADQYYYNAVLVGGDGNDTLRGAGYEYGGGIGKIDSSLFFPFTVSQKVHDEMVSVESVTMGGS